MRSSEGGAATSPPPGPEGERQLHWDPCWLSCRCPPPPPPATPPGGLSVQVGEGQGLACGQGGEGASCPPLADHPQARESELGWEWQPHGWEERGSRHA